MKKLFYLLFLCSTFSVYSQITVEKNIDYIFLNQYAQHFFTKDSSLHIQQILETDWKNNTNGATYGVIDEIVWMQYSFENTSSTPLEYYLYIPIHHIHHIDIYISDSLILKTGTGRKFINKTLPIRGYAIPITFPPGTLTVTLKIKHLQQSLRANTYLINIDSLTQIIQNNNNIIWFWRGIFIFALILSFVLFFAIKQKSFLFYFALYSSLGIFIGIETGNFFLVFEQDQLNMIITIKQFLSACCILFFALFINEFTQLKQLFPIIWKWSIRGIYLMFILTFLLAFPMIKESIFFYYGTYYFLIYSACILILFLVLLIITSFKKVKNSLELLIIYIIYICAIFIELLFPNIGMKNDKILVYNSILIISILELIIFIFIMGREAIKVYQDRNNLLLKQKEHQLEVIRAIVDSQELERNTVGHELHDMIGANLSIIKHKLDSKNLEVSALVDNTVDLIRNLSHGLMTPKVSGDALEHEIKDLCLLASSEKMKVQYYFHQWQFLEKKEISTHLFRIIQELLQNAIKHSQASLVYIQFIKDNDQISIMYEDNGIGMNLFEKGRGLLGIENRVKLIHGTIHYDSSPVHGVSINIELQA